MRRGCIVAGNFMRIYPWLEFFKGCKGLLLTISCLLILWGLVLTLKFFHIGITQQVSTSMPQGFYLTYPIIGKLKPGDIVLFRPPNWAEKMMLQHEWIRPNMLMLKHIVAISGDEVCIRSGEVFINGQAYAAVEKDYRPGKALPSLKFCRVLRKNEYFLMSDYIPNSFDSRYFGAINGEEILARGAKIR